LRVTKRHSGKTREAFSWCISSKPTWTSCASSDWNSGGFAQKLDQRRTTGVMQHGRPVQARVSALK
jgi:hypothetical protein